MKSNSNKNGTVCCKPLPVWVSENSWLFLCSVFSLL